MMAMRQSSLAIFLAMLLRVNAEHDDSALILLQTGAYMQRAAVPSNFFEFEDFAPSSSSAAGPHANEVRRSLLNSAPIALFDVGSNAVPPPQRNAFRTGLGNVGGNHVSLAEVDAPTPASPDNAAKENQVLSGLPMDAEQPQTLLEREAQRELQASKDAAEALDASTASEMQVLATEPPLAAASEALVGAQAAEVLQTEPVEQPKEKSLDLYEEETPDAAVKFVQQQADAGPQDDFDVDSPPTAHVASQNTQVIPDAPIKFDQQQADAGAQDNLETARQSTAHAASESSQVISDAPVKFIQQEADASAPDAPIKFIQQLADASAQGDLETARQSTAQAASERSQDPPGRSVAPLSVDHGLDETMRRLEEDERVLLAALQARRMKPE